VVGKFWNSDLGTIVGGFGLFGEMIMHQSIFPVAVLTALAAVTVPAAAQSPTSYPWCMKGARGGTSCYFRSYQECRTTLSGLGGHCIRSPYYNGPDRQ
jgi:Protein of unknown function (DUF3551)